MVMMSVVMVSASVMRGVNSMLMLVSTKQASMTSYEQQSSWYDDSVDDKRQSGLNYSPKGPSKKL